MRKLLLAVTLIGICRMTGYAQQRGNARKTKGIAVAFFDEERLRTSEGRATLDNFAFFLKPIEEIARRDFPDIQFKILRRGELVHLYDRTGLNVQNMQPALGYVFSAPGKKHYTLTGVQSETDFACAASKYFNRRSPSCSKELRR
jgi:hypothetical protein